MGMADDMITTIHCVAIPVTDQDQSKQLYERLGFEVRVDTELQPGFRWVELGPRGAETSLALVTSGDELPTGIDTGIRLVTPDTRTAHKQLSELGLEVSELLDWETAPLMFSFCDHDGNRLYISESGEHPGCLSSNDDLRTTSDDRGRFGRPGTDPSAGRAHRSPPRATCDAHTSTCVHETS